MKFLGLNFNKIDIERTKDYITPIQEIKVNSSINILNIKESKFLVPNNNEPIFESEFSYTVDYDPNIAKISFSGTVFFSLDTKQAQELMEKYKKKEIIEEVKIPLFNIIFKRSTIKALSFEEEFNLPPHIPLPSFKKTENKNNKKSNTS